MNNFRLSNKKVYRDSRSTIENLHNEKMESIFNNESTLDSKNKKLEYLKQKLELLNNNKSKTTKQVKTIFEINKEIISLKTEIHAITNNHELIDYIDKAWEFIESFGNDDTNNNDNNDNDNNDNHTNENDTNDTNKLSKDETIISNDSNENSILNFINKTGKSNKGEEYTKYYNKCFLNINVPYTGSVNNYCKNCKENNFEIDQKNGIIICTNCGVCENYTEFNSSSVNYNDSTHIEAISQPFSYQRKNHFKEWLNQLQGKEVTVIPEQVINLVLIELKKERITDSKDITSERIKKYLKKLKLNKYYEHIPNLISKITNKPPLVITPDFEDVLLKLFDKIQEPFKKYCPKERKNFLSYSYTLHKFCQLLGKDEYLIYFPLLKSREKLFEQEKIWRGICTDLNWKFVPSI